jgi:hypothetical protein
MGGEHKLLQNHHQDHQLSQGRRRKTRPCPVLRRKEEDEEEEEEDEAMHSPSLFVHFYV